MRNLFVTISLILAFALAGPAYSAATITISQETEGVLLLLSGTLEVPATADDFPEAKEGISAYNAGVGEFDDPQGFAASVIGDALSPRCAPEGCPPPGDGFSGLLVGAQTDGGGAAFDVDGTIFVDSSYLPAGGGTIDFDGLDISTRYAGETYETLGLLSGATLRFTMNTTGDTLTIKVEGLPPTADAGRDYEAPQGSVNLDFTGSECSDPCDSENDLDYTYDPGDGRDPVTTNSSRPVVSYPDTGSYTLRLRVRDTVQDIESELDSAKVTIYGGDDRPVANAGPVPDDDSAYSGIQGESITFDGSLSTDINDDITAYEWTWGDGTGNGAGVMDQHSYAADGAYYVTLTVTDSLENVDSDTASASISSDNVDPTANVGGPYTGTVGVAVQFDGTASTDTDGSIVRYDWVYSDDSSDEDAGPTPAHLFIDGDWTVELTVTDDRGATHTDQTTVTVTEGTSDKPFANPGPIDNSGRYYGVVGTPVAFDGSLSTDTEGLNEEEGGNIDQYDWNYGDGSLPGIDVGPTPPHTYTAPGIYRPILTVYEDGVPDSSQSIAVILPGGANLPPEANDGGPYTGEVDVDVQFDGTQSSDPEGGPLTYAWDFGDGSPVNNEPAPLHPYAVADDYDVTLTVSDGTSTDEDTTTASIGQVLQPPVADAGEFVNGAPGETVQFFGSATCEEPCTLTYDWDYGDGTDVDTNAGPEPTHVYATADEYTAVVQVTRDGGAYDTDNTRAFISDSNQEPVADAGGPYTGTAGVEFTLDGSQSSDDSAIVLWEWDFDGDGTIDDDTSGATPDVTYPDDGVYAVRLTVTDDDDVPNSDISDVRIGQAPVAPTARPGGPYSQADGMAVQFDGTASTDPDGLITLYEWDFENNGNVDDSSGPEPEYLYPGPGNYTVSLKVTDNDTLTDTRTASVTIGIGNRAPAADAGAKAYPGVVGTEVQFDGSGSSDPDGDSLTYSWNYGDGSDPGVGVSPRHTYSTAGPWKVILTVTDDDDVPSSDTTIALIGSGTQPPVADAGGPYDTIGAAIVFDGNGSSDPDGGNLTYLWDFGDGGFRSGVTPTHVYTAEGTFDVTLTVIDDTGKTAVDTTKAKVGFGLDPEVGCRDAGKQSVFLKDKKGKFKWNWKQGAATAKADFGNPLTATDYQVCLFDSVADELFPGFCVVVPAGADWKDKKKGFTYKSKTGVEGITKIVLKAGEGGKAKIKVRGKGMDLPRLPLSQNPEVVVLISNDAGVCWKSRFSTAKKNDEKKFKAK